MDYMHYSFDEILVAYDVDETEVRQDSLPERRSGVV